MVIKAVSKYGFCIGRGSLDNGYLDNFDNEFLNKYEIDLKIKKSYKYVLLFID
jgi:hypothetical protein